MAISAGPFDRALSSPRTSRVTASALLVASIELALAGSLGARGGLIFSDGFESGDTSAWSAVSGDACLAGTPLTGVLEGDLGPAPAGTFQSIACLEIRNDRASARGPELASSGIPLAAALGLTTIERLALVGPGSRRIAAQFTVLSRWGGPVDDASLPIRWLEVSGPARVAASGVTRYSLRRYDTLPPAADPFAVTVTGGRGTQFEIDTGLATFTVDEANPAFLAGIAIDPDDDGSGRVAVYSHTPGAGPRLDFDPGGGTITLQTPSGVVVDPGSFEIVEAGPVKAVVALRGHFTDQIRGAGGETLCVTDGGNLVYERFGYTVVATFVRGTRDLRLQVELRNECSDALFPPWTDEGIAVSRMSWELPFTGLVPTATYYAGDAAVAATAGAAQAVAEQRLGADLGVGWVRRAEVRLGAAVVESGTAFARPIVAVEDSATADLVVAAQLPWMRYREPQAVAVAGSTVSLRFVSEPITIGEGKGIWNFATIDVLPTGLVRGSTVAALESLRQQRLLELERGLLFWAPREYVNSTGVYPSLGTAAASTIKTNYLAWMNQLHDELVGPGGGWDEGKTFGSQLWPESGAADPFGVASANPDESNSGMNYWDPAGNELLEFLRSGEPRWVWDYALPAYWTQAFAAYLNIGDQSHGNRSGVAVISGGPGCADFAFPCTPTGSGGGQWHRSAFGSDDYTYDMSLELGYALRPNLPLRHRFEQAGRNVDARYDIPRAQQGTRECFVDMVDITRQVIQHFEMLANCAEFVPGAAGEACHDKLIEVYDEYALDNLNAGLMCERLEASCLGADPPLPTRCTTPQQFMINALMYPFFLRLWINYGEPPSSAGVVRDALVCGPVAQYQWAIPKLQNGVSIDPTFGANCDDQTGDGCWWGVMDCTLTGDQSAIVSCQSAQDSDGNFFMGSHTRPHTLYSLLVAQQIEPDIRLCSIVKAALDVPQFTGLPDDAQGGWAGVGHFLPVGWWKGVSQMMQGSVFLVGGYDTCADPPPTPSPCP